jgi:hypothetical protein
MSTRLVPRVVRGAVIALCLIVVAATSATAGGEVRRRGDCAGGEGDWDLRVEREDRNTLEVRFKIDDVDPGETWQLFLSDNGVGVFSGTKRANSEGEVRVRREIRDRAGTDHIKASGVNLDDGTTCRGSVAF